MQVAQYIFFKVYKLSAKQQFIDCAKLGKVLTRKCKNCGELHLATVYYCQKCGHKEFENVEIQGNGTVVTYTIITVAPAGFEKYTPYAWVVLNLDNSNLRISGFLANTAKPSDLPIGSKAKIVDFDERGIILEKQ